MRVVHGGETMHAFGRGTGEAGTGSWRARRAVATRGISLYEGRDPASLLFPFCKIEDGEWEDDDNGRSRPSASQGK
jgi:hypothetical protein